MHRRTGIIIISIFIVFLVAAFTGVPRQAVYSLRGKWDEITAFCRKDNREKDKMIKQQRLRTGGNEKNYYLTKASRVKRSPRKTCSIKFINAGKLNNLQVGKVVRLKVGVTSEDEEPEYIFLSSSNSEVAAVDEFGILVAKAPGQAVITAQTADGRNVRHHFRIVKHVEAIEFVNAAPAFAMGKNEVCQLEADIVPADATVQEVEWSSSDENVAVVDKEGTVTALADGSVSIYAAAKDGSGVSTVTDIEVITRVEKIRLFLPEASPFYSLTNGDGMVVKKGTAVSLKAKVKPSKATNKQIVWSSDNESVVSVSENGELYAKSCGTAIVTAAAADGGNVQDQITVTVQKIPRDNCIQIAHRGRSDCAPENSLAAIELAMQDGVTDIEFDIWETADHQFVVSHDESLKISCGIDAKVTDMTLEEVMACRIVNGSQLDQYSDEYIPSLDQVLQMAVNYPGGMLHIELKEDFNKEMLEKLLIMIAQYGLQDSVKLITFSEENIKAVRSIEYVGGGNIPLEYLCYDVNEDTLAVCEKYNADIGVCYDRLTRKKVEKCHQRGLAVNAWTVDDFAEAYRLAVNLQVDAVTSDYILVD